MLVGRDRERQLIANLVAAARVGQSGVLVLAGEVGIGKTALLEDAAGAASGMQLLRATGTQSEYGVPFGGLHQLLRPALGCLNRIPAPQTEALSTALALTPGAGGDRFAVGAATLSLLSRFAEDGPLAVLIDEAHLLDRPSAQALVFAARRLTADPVVLLVAVRTGSPSPLTEADLPVLRVEGLPPADADALVRAAGFRLGSAAAARLFEVTRGNPLGLLVLADDVDRLGALPPTAPVPVPASLARAFARRADRLSAPAQAALLVAAIAGDDLALVARCCRLLDIDVAALEETEAADLLRIDGDAAVFRHNLVRSAVYAEAPAGQRRATHRAVAAALGPDEADRRAWHLGEAALGPDEDTAGVLEQAAVRARNRSAHAVAADGFERAAQLTPDPDRRVRRLVDAAESAWLAGGASRATALLHRAEALPQPPGLRARSAGLRGTVAARTGSVEEARDVLMAAGIASAEAAPDTAILLLTDAILACFFLADTETVADAAARIDRLVDRASSEQARWVAGMASGAAGVLTGSGGLERIRGSVRLIDAAGPLLRDRRLAPWLVLGPLFLRERGTGRELVATVVDDLRRRTDIGGLPFLLFQVARDHATRDAWHAAEVNYAEGIALARETGHTSDLAACLAGLAWLEARQGREATCRAHAAEAQDIADRHHLALFRIWSLFALGELELGLGRAGPAVDHLERLETLLADLGLDDVDLSPAPELVEALLREGRPGPARDLATRYAARARSKGQPWALARAARTMALTTASTDAEPAADRQFQLALAHHARTLDTFELARTQLAHGAHLRRARRRVDARVPLRAALDLFDALGAAPWAEQTAGELRATGETARRRQPGGIRELTPQEVQIAGLLAAGRTTRETAAALFLSPKTVEYHLRHVYIKLGVTSRAELSARLAARP